MTLRPVDVAFTPSVRAAQQRKHSREIYERMEMGNSIDESLAAFIGQVRSFYLATASAEGQPYIQHRGGPPGFLHVFAQDVAQAIEQPDVKIALLEQEIAALRATE